MSAFLLLEVTPDANDTQIKAAYLAAVRRYPPEHYPERYEQIRAAYEAIATERDRLSYLLFNPHPIDPMQAMALLMKPGPTPRRSKPDCQRLLVQSVTDQLTAFTPGASGDDDRTGTT